MHVYRSHEQGHGSPTVHFRFTHGVVMKHDKAAGHDLGISSDVLLKKGPVAASALKQPHFSHTQHICLHATHVD